MNRAERRRGLRDDTVCKHGFPKKTDGTGTPVCPCWCGFEAIRIADILKLHRVQRCIESAPDKSYQWWSCKGCDFESELVPLKGVDWAQLQDEVAAAHGAEMVADVLAADPRYDIQACANWRGPGLSDHEIEGATRYRWRCFECSEKGPPHVDGAVVRRQAEAHLAAKHPAYLKVRASSE